MAPSTRGLLFAFLAAASYSFSITAAGVAIAAGSDPVTVVALRAGIGLPGALVMVWWMKPTLRVERSAYTAVLFVAMGILMVNYGYMGAIPYIPVSLAVLIFFTFPLIVLLLSSLLARTVPPLASLAACALAFLGLALALGPSFATLDWRGVPLAGMAAAGATLTFFFGAKAARRMSIAGLTLHTHLLVVPAVVAVMMATGGVNPPELERGWWGIGLTGIGYLCGMIFQFLSVRLAEPAPSAMVFNTEPLITIALAALVLGERLSLLQYLGGLAVIGAVLVAARQTANQKTVSPEAPNR